MDRDRDEALERAIARWRNAPRARPADVVTPGPGQESVWDYPRPPRVERARRSARVEQGGVPLAQSDRALRVVETAGPPCYYLPPGDVRGDRLAVATATSICEWKGLAHYLDARAAGLEVASAAWSYRDPLPGYEALRDHVAFFPGRVDCWLDDERVAPQPGHYYGGWITADITGPFKGIPGSEGW